MSQLLIDLGVILILIVGISQFRTPRGARLGNLIAAFALLCAMAVVLYRHRLTEVPLIAATVGVGAATGWLVAVRVHMIQIPAMVAFQHGAGGVAAFLVSAVELTRATGEKLAPLAEIAALLGLVIGAATFAGSMIASGKLANRLRQTPVMLPRHNSVLVATVAAVVMLAAVAGATGDRAVLVPVVSLMVPAAVALGVVFSIRIGGADMPVLISFLNATAGLAAAFCGIAIGNRLLIACGATVAASGSILTHVMCRAMNRKLVTVFAGFRPLADQTAATTGPSPMVLAGPLPGAPGGSQSAPVPAPEPRASGPAAPQAESVDLLAQAVAVAREAQQVVIIPGYGMALADAQSEVVQLAEKLTQMGKEVWFAIHPVAGRMPGHMHVLLAEAEADYGRIRELNDINPELPKTDLALIVGACDVVNPAAIQSTATPISGMPILRAHEARRVVMCNLDEKPGYSGVPNPLYRDPNTILLLGDAKDTIRRLRLGLG